MTTGTKTLETMWTTKNRTLLLALLVLAMVAALLVAQSPAEASAFPGANGKIVFSSDRTTGAGVDNPEGDEEIFSMNPDGTGLKQLTRNNAGDGAPAVSADGKKITFVSRRTGDFEVFAMNADGTAQTNLTKNDAGDDSPTFSPDGKKVAFVSGRTGNLEIFVMNADGTGQTNLTSDLQNDSEPTFSPDGTRIAFASNRNGNDSDLFVMNADGKQQTPLTSNDLVSDSAPSFSPDGKKIAFTSNRDGAGDPNDFDIFEMNADGTGTPTRFTNSRARDVQPAYSPDGKKVAFVSDRNGGDADIFLMDATTNETGLTPLTANADLDLNPNWQPTAATFTVTSQFDDGDGVCNSTCTLREAITASNGVLGQLRNTIRFDIPGSGVQIIAPSTRLPTITRAVVIDGYTQPGSSPNTLATGDNAVLNIELTGTSMSSGGDGLAISHTSGSSIVRGLVINQFPEGISVGGNTVGSRIEGNFIGIDPTGAFDRGNGDDGVNVGDGATGTVVGGTTPAARNVISGNVCNAVSVFNASGNSIQGNYIGTDRTGTRSIPNGDGFICGAIDIRNSSSGNTVGGTSAGAGNLISGNACDGVFVESSGNKVLGNRVGTTANGTGALGNGEAGVVLTSNTNTSTLVGDGTAAGSNTIAFNVEDGVEVRGGTGGAISRNSIFSNGESGIDLSPFGVTPNDGDNPATPQLDPDGDTGPNNLQNFPVLSSATTSSTNTTVTGKLNSTPGKTFTVQFFSNPAGGDEGKTFLGQKSVLTDGSGNASFTFQTTTRAAVGQNVTATATDPAGNTSEFSAPKTVTDAIAPTVNSTSPAAGATGVSPSVNVSAVFSEAMNPSTINTATVTLKRAGTTIKVGATVTYDATAKRAILNPKTNLKPGATYVATVTSGTKDVAGNALDQSPSTAGNQPKSWQFKLRK
jgi:CSLREA domain-containing protein